MFRLRAFGGLGLQRDGVALDGAGAQRKALALLAVVAVARGSGVGRDKLVALFWPESDAEHGRGALKQTLHVLRRQLGTTEALLGSAEVRLNPAVIESDVGLFLDALDGGHAERAVGYYAGPFLDGVHVDGSPELERWIDGERSALAQRHIEALEQLARAADARGARDEAVGWWRRLQAADLLSGRAAVGLMLALDAAGDRAGALQHARVHETILREEVGSPPDPAVTALAARLREVGPLAERGSPARGGAAVGAASLSTAAPARREPPPYTPHSDGAAPPLPGAPASATTAPVPAGSAGGALGWRGSRARYRWLAAAALAVIVATGAWVARTRLAGGGVDRPVSSVAVLPFVNIGPDRRDDYLCDGVADELITALGRIAGLRVAARTSAFAFRGSSRDVREIGEQLGVGHVLEGSVRRVGDRLRVTARLIDAGNGYRIWSAEYDGSLADAFAVQDDISRAIVEALRVRLPAPAGGPRTARAAPSSEAYRLYLRGRHAWRQRRPEQLLQAIDLFTAAADADSTFANAYAGLADVYVVLPDYGDFAPDVMYQNAEAAVRRALALDSTVAGPYATLGLVRHRQYRWDEAERAYRRALTINPSYAPAHQWYGKALVIQGRVEEGLAEFDRARSLDPLSPVIRYNVGQTLLWNGRHAAAADQFREALSLDSTFAPARGQLAFTYTAQRRYGDAVAQFRRVIAMQPGEPSAADLAQLGYGYAVSGQRDSALAILAGLRTRAERAYVSPALVALVHVGLGDRDSAMQYLERAFWRRDPDLQGFIASPMLDPLRTDPRFVRLREQMRLE